MDGTVVSRRKFSLPRVAYLSSFGTQDEIPNFHPHSSSSARYVSPAVHPPFTNLRYDPVNLFWYVLIWRILIRALFFKKLADERSDDEDEVDDKDD